MGAHFFGGGALVEAGEGNTLALTSLCVRPFPEVVFLVRAVFSELFFPRVSWVLCLCLFCLAACFLESGLFLNESLRFTAVNNPLLFFFFSTNHKWLRPVSW